MSYYQLPTVYIMYLNKKNINKITAYHYYRKSDLLSITPIKDEVFPCQTDTQRTQSMKMDNVTELGVI